MSLTDQEIQEASKRRSASIKKDIAMGLSSLRRKLNPIMDEKNNSYNWDAYRYRIEKYKLSSAAHDLLIRLFISRRFKSTNASAHSKTTIERDFLFPAIELWEPKNIELIAKKTIKFFNSVDKLEKDLR